MESSKSGVAATTATVPSLKPRSQGIRSTTKFLDSFRSATDRIIAPAISEDNRHFNAKAAAFNTANTPLVRRLKGRHLQMIAIGGSIGTGLFIGTGAALATGGPGSLLIAFLLLGMVLYFTIQALGEMAVMFPVAGSFSTFATRFIDPAVGFAFGWNYAMQWLVCFPVEVMSASICLEYWQLDFPEWASVTLFLLFIIGINMCSVKVYGEFEYCFSIIKVGAIIGFIILGAVINCGGGQDGGYMGGKFWSNPGAFNNGFKGFCNIVITASYSFTGTELVGLAAAETHNPSKAIPTAIKQVFWRIVIFYVLAVAVVGILVPYTAPELISRNNIDAKASPFIIAIRNAGIQGLDSVMNVVAMIAVLSVGNSALYGSTRTLAALADQGQAPRILGYVDRKGRPLVAVLVSCAMGSIAYVRLSEKRGLVFTWLFALSGLSSIFTWSSICVSHIHFRRAWAIQGNKPSDLIYQSPTGLWGSYFGLASLMVVLIAQFWVAVSPIGASTATPRERVENFFAAYMAMPVVICAYLFYKIRYRPSRVKPEEADLKTGMNEFESDAVRKQWKEDQLSWPRWKQTYRAMC